MNKLLTLTALVAFIVADMWLMVYIWDNYVVAPMEQKYEYVQSVKL